MSKFPYAMHWGDFGFHLLTAEEVEENWRASDRRSAEELMGPVKEAWGGAEIETEYDAEAESYSSKPGAWRVLVDGVVKERGYPTETQALACALHQRKGGVSPELRALSSALKQEREQQQ